MSSSDFRNILVRDDTGKAERLFRAVVSAFCCITRPSRRDVAQLEDLALPLFDLVSVESRRYVAAALSECEIAPENLIRRLAAEPVEIAAPVLLRSPALSDVDLIGLIGKHGASHARIIGQRPNLHPSIAHLARALENTVCAMIMPGHEALSVEIAYEAEAAPEPLLDVGPEPSVAFSPEPLYEPSPVENPVVSDGWGKDIAAIAAQRINAAEMVRERLRRMMRPTIDPQTAPNDTVDPEAFGRLRDCALTGDVPLLENTLADILVLNRNTARVLCQGSDYSALMDGLRSISLTEEQAFLITSAMHPRHFPHPESIRMFLARYRQLDRAGAAARLRSLKLEMVASWISQHAHPSRTVHSATA